MIKLNNINHKYENNENKMNFIINNQIDYDFLLYVKNLSYNDL